MPKSSGESTPFADIAATSKRLRETASRNEKIAVLAEQLRRLPDEELPIVVSFLSGRPRQGKLGVGWITVRSLESGPATPEAALTVRELDAALEELLGISGPGSTGRRRSVLQTVFSRATDDEADFLRQLLVGGVRQGAAHGLMVEALAQATDQDVDVVRRSVTRSGSVVEAARGGLEEPTSDGVASGAGLRLFRPLSPMLASSAKDVADALGRGGASLVEGKADGARVQVHRKEGVVRVFTRKGNDVTDSVPEIVEAVQNFKGGDLILDGEALVWTGGRSRPFQITMRRIGAQPTQRALSAMPLRVFFFDCLYADGRELLDSPLKARRAVLEKVVPLRYRLPHLVVAGVDDIDAATNLSRSVREQGFEGLMVKALESVYAAGRRGSAWLKVKPVHTLDLVVLAAEWGSGRRVGWLSNLHLGARDPGADAFVMLGKTFKGLTDTVLKWQTQRLQELEVRRTRSTVWVKPELVVEIAFDGVQMSPRYPSGLTLRFARVKGYRPDKDPSEANTIEDLRALYEAEGGGAAFELEPERSVSEQTDLFDLD